MRGWEEVGGGGRVSADLEEEEISQQGALCKACRPHGRARKTRKSLSSFPVHLINSHQVRSERLFFAGHGFHNSFLL